MLELFNRKPPSTRPPLVYSGEATERFTEGRSGAFFYFTHDRRYIIKTATTEEFATLLRILPR